MTDRTRDRRQHRSIQRGDVPALLEDKAGIESVEVLDIGRQQGAYQEAVSALARGDVADGFAKPDDLGRVTGIPEVIPPGVRLAYLQVDEDAENDPSADLVFRVRRLRKKSRIGLPLVWPSESPRKREITCGGCQKCFG